MADLSMENIYLDVENMGAFLIGCYSKIRYNNLWQWKGNFNNISIALSCVIVGSQNWVAITATNF